MSPPCNEEVPRKYDAAGEHHIRNFALTTQRIKLRSERIERFWNRYNNTGNRGSSVGVVTEVRAGQSDFESRQGQGFLLFATASRPALLGHTQPPLLWVPVALSLRVKRPGSEADHSPPPPSLKTRGAITPLCIRLHYVVLC